MTFTMTVMKDCPEQSFELLVMITDNSAAQMLMSAQPNIFFRQNNRIISVHSVNPWQYAYNYFVINLQDALESIIPEGTTFTVVRSEKIPNSFGEFVFIEDQVQAGEQSVLQNISLSSVVVYHQVLNRNVPQNLTLNGVITGTHTTFNVANFLDKSGNNNHLMLGGKTLVTILANPWGIGQDCVTLTGQNIVGLGSQWILPLGTYTFECRFKRSATQNTTQVVLARWGNSGFRQYLLYFDSSNRLIFIHATSDNGVGTTITSPVITDTNAHHLAIVLSGGNISMFLDGTRVVDPVSAGNIVTIGNIIPFRIGDYDDTSGNLPFPGTIGDIRLSNSARYTGSTYVVPTVPFVSDANTLALVPMDNIEGAYLGTPVFQTNVLIRTGHTQASGGWANPDGPLKTLDNKWYFTVSGYNGSYWSTWAVIADTLSDLVSGNGTLQATAIQSPAVDEGDISANGSVVLWNGQYYHYYHDGAANVSIRVSSGSNLNSAYPQGTIIFQGNTGSYSVYADPWVRVSKDGTKLEMYFIGVSGPDRFLLYSTSTDAVTWSAKTILLNTLIQPGYTYYSGEFSQVNGVFGFSDGAHGPSEARAIIRWGSFDGTTWLPLLKGIDPAQIAVYDASPYLDLENDRLIILATNSNNTQPTQPTDSDIGVWFVPLILPDGVSL